MFYSLVQTQMDHLIALVMSVILEMEKIVPP